MNIVMAYFIENFNQMSELLLFFKTHWPCDVSSDVRLHFEWNDLNCMFLRTYQFQPLLYGMIYCKNKYFLWE